MTNRIQIGITICVALIAVVLGGVVFSELDAGMALADDRLHDRAEEVYGEEYRIVQSAECWDICVQTATTTAQQRADILYVLKQRPGYVSLVTLRRNTVGITFGKSDVLTQLVKDGVVERRASAGFLSQPHYRYTGESSEVAILSEATVEERVHRRLYVTGTSMGAGAIADDLPVGETRVRRALETLAARGVVDGGYVSTGILGQYQWIDTRHGTLPDSRFHRWDDIAQATGAVLIAVLGLATWQYHRRDEALAE